MALEVDVFIGNEETHEVHHKNSVTGSCNLAQIKEPILFESLADAKKLGFDCCYWCFRSKR